MEFEVKAEDPQTKLATCKGCGQKSLGVKEVEREPLGCRRAIGDSPGRPVLSRRNAMARLDRPVTLDAALLRALLLALRRLGPKAPTPARPPRRHS